MTLWRHTRIPAHLRGEPPPDDDDGYDLTEDLYPVLRSTWDITCRGCAATASVPFGSTSQAVEQVALWCQGWRRNPDTRDDYCPTCAP